MAYTKNLQDKFSTNCCFWFLSGLLSLSLITGCRPETTPPPEVAVEENSPTPDRPTPTVTPRPTSTPRPATPTPVPTPTVTPTPIIYRVQSGDTLLSIAIQFDRSTELIQEANGIVDPRVLQIGQELIIPAPVEEEEEPPTPTPTPLPLTVERLNFQETGQGRLWCLGQVTNPGQEPVSEVVIEATLFDGQGRLLAREATFAQLDVVRPDQAVPFAILFETPPDSFAQYQVIAVSAVPVSTEARYYFDLETSEVVGEPVGVSRYRLAGQLHNVGQADVETVRLVAVAYDDQARVLAQRQAELDVTLFKAGATTPFEIDLTITQGVVEEYRVFAQALRVE